MAKMYGRCIGQLDNGAKVNKVSQWKAPVQLFANNNYLSISITLKPIVSFMKFMQEFWASSHFLRLSASHQRFTYVEHRKTITANNSIVK